MKTSFLLSLLLLPSLCHAQGTFPPASGPAVPIMKTLDQIEPRKPVAPSPAIPVAGPHLTITQPGSYYLTGNVTVASGNAILVTASDVTLDLNGFRVGGVPNTASSATAIRIFDANNVTVKNGTIGDIGYGIIALGNGFNSHGQRFENLNFSQCYIYGISFSSSSYGSLVSACIFSKIGNTTSGLTPAAIVDSTGGIRVQDCAIGEVTSIVAGDPATGISGAPGSFYLNNSIANCKTGIFRGKYKDNLFFNCTTTIASGTDAGGNN